MYVTDPATEVKKRGATKADPELKVIEQRYQPFPTPVIEVDVVPAPALISVPLDKLKYEAEEPVPPSDIASCVLSPAFAKREIV